MAIIPILEFLAVECAIFKHALLFSVVSLSPNVQCHVENLREWLVECSHDNHFHLLLFIWHFSFLLILRLKFRWEMFLLPPKDASFEGCDAVQ